MSGTAPRATLVDLFEGQVQRRAEKPALRYRVGGMWRTITWAQWADRSRCAAAALLDLGVGPGDRVGLLSSSRARWVLAETAVLLTGAASVPIYPSLLADVVGYQLKETEAQVLFAEDPTQLEKIYAEENKALRKQLKAVVLFDRVARLSSPDLHGRLDVDADEVVGKVEGESFRVISWETFIAYGRQLLERDPELLSEPQSSVKPDTLAAIYYTSGTSGQPKGVMLTHDNFVYETEVLGDLMPVGVRDEQLLFLPLSHIVARITIALQMRVGYVTAFADSIDRAIDDCLEIQPTFLVSVPRFYEKIQEEVGHQLEKAGNLQKRVFRWAFGVGKRLSGLKQKGKSPGGLLAIQARYADRLALGNIKQRLGGRIRFLLSGAAPLSESTAEFFHAAGLLVLEGYGLTETTGAATLNLTHRFRFGSVGAPLPGVEIRFGEGGEIHLRGRNIMKGYYKDPERTAEVLNKAGWLRTGDLGRLDEGGLLVITGRQKDIIITTGGKNIAPQRIEHRLERSPYIQRAIVLGDCRRYAVALLVPGEQAVRTWAKESGLGGDFLSMLRHPKVRELFAQTVAEVNAGLASFESVKRFAVLNRDLSAKQKELTPTGKIRRAQVAESFKELVDSLYEGDTGDLMDVI